MTANWERVFFGSLIILGIIMSPVVERIIVVLLYLDWQLGKPSASTKISYREPGAGPAIKWRRKRPNH